MKPALRILAVGDIVGRIGREVLQSRLEGIRTQHRIDLVIVNGENAAHGFSITPQMVSEMHGMGVNAITSGNHIWDNRDILKIIDEDPSLLRPANYPSGVRGHGYCLLDAQGFRVCVINLQGRTHMEPIDCPFRKFDEIYSQVRDKSDIIIVDFHAEATAEKIAFGWYVDGRASAVYGTHTHVQTADERILPCGTGYITDIGMTGSFDSVIGMEKGQSISRFVNMVRVRYEPASGDPRINGIVLSINGKGRAEEIFRIAS